MSIDYSSFAFPKNARIVNKKLLKDKKGKCEICGKRGQTEKHHRKTKRKWWRRYRRKFNRSM